MSQHLGLVSQHLLGNYKTKMMTRFKLALEAIIISLTRVLDLLLQKGVMKEDCQSGRIAALVD